MKVEIRYCDACYNTYEGRSRGEEAFSHCEICGKDLCNHHVVQVLGHDFCECCCDVSLDEVIKLKNKAEELLRTIIEKRKLGVNAV